MSDYRFGDDYKLNIYPSDAIDCWGEIDINKVEAVEIELVDFIRKPDDNSRYFELFGTPERAARTLGEYCYNMVSCAECGIRCEGKRFEDGDALLEWLRGDA